jgi:protein tyrosine/serine phosphatase
VPNLHRVSAVLYRSAQPTAQGFAELESLGVRTVLSLRAFHVDRLPPGSALRARRISFKSWHPEEEDVVRFLRIVRDPANQPVLVHCRHGADRTGMMVALLRIVDEGWSREDAVREMVEGGFGFHAVWRNMIEYVEQVDVERLRRLAEIPPARGAR